MKMLKRQSFLVLVITMLSVVKTFSQVDDGPTAPPQTPINDYTLPLMVVAVFLGAYFFYVSNQKRRLLNK